MGLGDLRRDPSDAALSGILERLPAAPIGYRRLSGTLVRRLSGPQPIDRVRPLPALRRNDPLLAQPGDPGGGDNVGPATHAARLWPCQTVASVRPEPGADSDHGLAVARQHAAYRYLCRSRGLVTVYPRASRR